MNLRIAAIGVGHWHALYDAAYLKTLVQWPGMQLIAIHDPEITERNLGSLQAISRFVCTKSAAGATANLATGTRKGVHET